MAIEIQKYFNYAKRFYSPKKLNFLILYVTSDCNFKCQTCFFHDNLGKSGDLTLEEFGKISAKLGDVSILLIGGGEPFLRPDIEEICSIFVKNNGIDTLYIPTNGFFTERIVSIAQSLVKKFPKLILSINPSLDGMAQYHDRLRGIPGSFDKTIKTIQELAFLKKKYKNLQIIVNSVIHRENIAELKKLAVFLRKFDLDYQAFEIMRGDPRDKNLAPANLEEIKDMHDFILKNRQEYLKKNPAGNAVVNFLNRFAVLGHENYVQKIKEKVLSGNKWPMRCAVGNSIAVVYPDGNAALCELREPIGNLRQYDYDLNRLLAGAVARDMKKQIKKNRCSCTHICFINAGIAADWKTIPKLFYFYPKFI